MKILIYGDVHWSQYSSIIRQRGTRYSARLENCIQSLNWAEGIAEKYNCEMIVCLGDFFDSATLNAEELTALTEVHWSSIPHYFIVGNHEIASANLEINSTTALSQIGKLITAPYLDLSTGNVLIFLPYILESERKSFLEHLESFGHFENWSTAKENAIVFSHNDMKGIRYGQFESKIGFNISELEDHCRVYINGHLHNQQQVSEKILNLGNLTGQNFSEDASKHSHCVGILDTDTFKIKLLNNPYAFCFYKWDIDSIEQLTEYLENIFNNAVLSIKCSIDLTEQVRELLKNDTRIFDYRLITKHQLKDAVKPEYALTKIDHVEAFKEYITKIFTSSELLSEELNHLI